MKAAKLELHWAAQAVSAVGSTLAEKQADDSHTALTWSSSHQAMIGAVVGSRAQQAGLQLAALELLWIGDGRVLDREPLDGRTLDAAVRWFGDKLNAGLVRPGYEMPDSPLAHGSAFGTPTADHAALASLYSLAAESLGAKRSAEAGASTLRCWPHHFDLAFLIQLDQGGGEAARSIGVGFSPGDGSYDSPYFYVTPWPYPDATASLPQLAGGGVWHTQDWTGAVLEAKDAGSALGLGDFLDAAIPAGRALLAG